MNTIKVRNAQGEEVEIQIGGAFSRAVKDRFDTSKDGMDSYFVKRYLAEEGVTLKDVLRAMDIGDINAMKVERLLENDGTKPLFNAVVEDGLRLGFIKDSNWQALVAKSVGSAQMSAEHYELVDDEDEYTMRDVGQGAPIPTGQIKVGEQTIRLNKRGRGIEWTDEAKSMRIDMVALFFRLLGKKLGRSYENTAVYRLLNGYFSDGSDAAPTIGMKTAGTLSLPDIFYAAKYHEEELGFSPTRMVMNLNTATQITELKDGNGGYLFGKELKDGDFPNLVNSDPFISSIVPDNRIVLVDTNYSLIKRTYKQFGVEFDRSVKTQVNGSYGTEISEFEVFQKDARLVMTIDQAR